MSFIDDEQTVRRLYPAPRDLRILDRLDRSCRFFIERSPLLIIGSVRGGDGIDLSPRGGMPGFVRVLTDRSLAIPDRAGNNRLDTMGNLLVNREVGLFFVIPGIPETLRIRGAARLTRDPALLDGFARRDQGQIAIVVTVRCAFIHCARALNHARLWQSDHRLDPKVWSAVRAEAIPDAAD
jgi:uncharacterized protein